jgi:RecB family endonuclease NucS
MRLVIATCSVDYAGRLSAHLPLATRVITGVIEVWKVIHHKTSDILVVNIHEIHEDLTRELGVDPGLIKDGVEADLQKLLAEHIELLGEGTTLVKREYMTAIGPVDILATDEKGGSVAVEIKRRGDIDGVEQLTRYLELMNRDPHLAPVRGVYAAQEIKPQARTLAEDRGIECVVLDYDNMRGLDDSAERLF